MTAPQAPETARFRAPGRVNLMGDHTDYNDGFVLPLAIDRECTIEARPHERVRVHSRDEETTVDVAADGSTEPGAVEPAWGRYVAGVVRALAERGRPARGIDAVLASSVPRGSGLSSSAALEVAVALALCDAASFEPAPLELARACQDAEHLARGVPSGIMDQLASVRGREGCALLVDCRSLDVEYVRLPRGLAVLVVHSGMPRELEHTEYAQRRAACERIARERGVPALRDATLDQVWELPLARHVVTENARVHQLADALRRDDREAAGHLLDESHVSLRDDFRVSTPELDLLVRVLVDAGAYGARLTGAGFGGAVVALVDAARADDVARDATARYRERTPYEPEAFVCEPVEGAGPLE